MHLRDLLLCAVEGGPQAWHLVRLHRLKLAHALRQPLGSRHRLHTGMVGGRRGDALGEGWQGGTTLPVVGGVKPKAAACSTHLHVLGGWHAGGVGASLAALQRGLELAHSVKELCLPSASARNEMSALPPAAGATKRSALAACARGARTRRAREAPCLVRLRAGLKLLRVLAN